jgi:hypothetical protein
MSQPKMAAHIAKELRRMHEVELPGSKEPQLWIELHKFVEEGASFYEEGVHRLRLRVLCFASRISRILLFLLDPMFLVQVRAADGQTLLC